MNAASSEPLRYVSEMERVEPDEADTAREIVATMRSISETTFKDYGHAVRSVHAKSHGILKGTLTVPDGLPPSLAQGAFARPGTHPVILRFSTNPGDILDDAVSTPRGLALKILDVNGPRLPGSETARTQDFVLVNGPAFFASSARQFSRNLKLLAATTDKSEGLKKAFSVLARGLETGIEAVGFKSSTLLSLGGQPETHILGETFYSQAPVLWGDYVAKVSVAPVSPELLALTGAQLDLAGHPDGIRDALVAFFRDHGGDWELRAQLCNDLKRMPIEDPSKEWKEQDSPFRPVAQIRVEPQEAWSHARSAVVDDGYAFSPWHGLAAHRPLGSIMRVRKLAYEEGARFRAEHNGMPVAEPRSAVDLPA